MFDYGTLVDAQYDLEDHIIDDDVLVSLNVQGFYPRKFQGEISDWYDDSNTRYRVKNDRKKTEPNQPRQHLYTKAFYSNEDFYLETGKDDYHFVNGYDTVFYALYLADSIGDRNRVYFSCDNKELRKKLLNTVNRLRYHVKKANAALDKFDNLYLKTHAGARAVFDKHASVLLKKSQRIFSKFGYDNVTLKEGPSSFTLVFISGAADLAKVVVRAPFDKDDTIKFVDASVWVENPDHEERILAVPEISEFLIAAKKLNEMVTECRKDAVMVKLGGG